MMTPERWRQVETVFQTALDITREHRERFLAEACAGDEVLRREVEHMIEGYEAADEFLELERHYSFLRAISGSTRVARRAGM
jgi:hypothetical protein